MTTPFTPTQRTTSTPVTVPAPTAAGRAGKEPLIPAVSYGRVSTEMQAQHGTSLAAQEEGCAKAIEAAGGRLVQHFSDDGVSGEFYLFRPGIQAALAMVESGQARILCIDMVDRSGRNVDAVRDIAKRVWAARGVLMFANQGVISNDAIGRFTLTSQASAAELLKELVKENTKRGRRKKAIAGEQPTRATHPYGYHIVRKADVLQGTYPHALLGQYQVKPDEAEVVLTMYARVIAGDSVRRIVQWLYDQGIKSPGRCNKNPCAQWAHRTISKILQNPLYKGEPVWGKTQHAQTEDRLKAGFKSARYSWVADQSDWVPLKSPAIISPEMWEAVQEAMRANQAAHGGNPNRCYLLSGIVRCNLCGGRSSGVMSKNGRDVKAGRPGTLHYRCQWAHSKRSVDGNNCKGPYYNGRLLEQIVRECLRVVTDTPEALQAAVRAWERSEAAEAAERARVAAIKARPAPTTEEIAALQAELTALDAREQATVAAQIEGIQAGASPRFYNSVISAIAAERKAKEDALLSFIAPTGATEDEAAEAARQVAARADEMSGGITRAAMEIGDILTLLLSDDTAPFELRQGAVSRVIEKIIPVIVKPEGQIKSVLTGAQVYLRDDFFASRSEIAEPLLPVSARRLLRNGALITLRAQVQSGGVLEIIPEVVNVGDAKGVVVNA